MVRGWWEQSRLLLSQGKCWLSCREETPQFPSFPPPKVGDSAAPVVREWALCSSSSVEGDQLVSLDLRTESATFSCRPGSEDRKEAKWVVRSQKRISYRMYIYCVLFDVSFLLSFFKPQTFQNHTAGVRRISNWKHCIVLNEQRQWVLYLQLLSR